ncbi:RlmF-related methyltransferase [Vibrio lentus]|nr:RlmF-related methyltransferase [Vibrio lentus]
MQADSESIFKGVIKDNERYDVTICNPPFHGSQEEAEQGSQRKARQLSSQSSRKQACRLSLSVQTRKTVQKPVRCSEQTNIELWWSETELWCPGGEAAFILKMAKGSQLFSTQVLWFTTLISKKDNVDMIRSERRS